MNMHDQHMHDGDARERILSLTDDYLNGTLGPAETAELEALLTEDPVARQAFLDASLLHAQLAATPVALGCERGVEAASKGDRHLLLRKKSQSSDTHNEPVPKRSLAGAAAVAAGLLLAAACLLLIVTKHAALPQAGGDHLTRPATAPQHGDDSHYDNRQLSIAMVAVLHEGGSQTEAADAPA
ncbi:MAG: hypothetical protein HQ464_06170, partial [Planctomycetes bacterium]|nr:hypothetical protein [Planctomycetota bacterium]